MSAITAVIAAGGYGSRCLSLAPKALLKAGGITYLEMLLSECKSAGIESGLIYCNRKEYMGDIYRISKKINGFEAVSDSGVKSTFELMIRSAAMSSSQRLLFCYGHAPRPASHIEGLIRVNSSAVVSVVKASTKRRAVIFEGDQFVEPPYLLRKSLVDASSATTWGDFFDRLGVVNGVILQGPGEFNSPEEKGVYDKYLRSWQRKACNPYITAR